MIPEGEPSVPAPAAAIGSSADSVVHSADAHHRAPTGMASTTMEATQLGPALLPHLNQR